MRSPVLVIDNGASAIKAGISTGFGNDPKRITNAIVRTTSKGNSRNLYIGHEIEECKDYSSLNYRLPFEKGYLNDWDLQKAVWDRMFDDVFKIEPQNYSLLVTEPYFNLPNVQETYDQLIFEEWEFESYHRSTSAALMPYGNLFDDPPHPTPECMLIVDSGFSFTHVAPVVKGAIAWNAVRRIDVGGKLLTNHLKELVSFRQWNMMEETYIVNAIKESCCYVSQDFDGDLEASRIKPRSNPIVQEYVLPELSHNRLGFVRTADSIRSDTDQVVYMNNERFSVPEVLFRPSDVGLEQAGLAETIAISIASLPEEVRGLMWANIGLVGGNVVIPGFESRLLRELRALAPVECEVSIFKADDPIITTYQCALALARSPAQFAQLAITRADYLESGSDAVRRKFKGDWRHAKAAVKATGTTAEPPKATRAATAGTSARKDSISTRRDSTAKPPATKKDTPKAVGGGKTRAAKGKEKAAGTPVPSTTEGAPVRRGPGRPPRNKAAATTPTMTPVTTPVPPPVTQPLPPPVMVPYAALPMGHYYPGVAQYGQPQYSQYGATQYGQYGHYAHYGQYSQASQSGPSPYGISPLYGQASPAGRAIQGGQAVPTGQAGRTLQSAQVGQTPQAAQSAQVGQTAQTSGQPAAGVQPTQPATPSQPKT